MSPALPRSQPAPCRLHRQSTKHGHHNGSKRGTQGKLKTMEPTEPRPITVIPTLPPSPLLPSRVAGGGVSRLLFRDMGEGVRDGVPEGDYRGLVGVREGGAWGMW